MGEEEGGGQEGETRAGGEEDEEDNSAGEKRGEECGVSGVMGVIAVAVAVVGLLREAWALWNSLTQEALSSSDGNCRTMECRLVNAAIAAVKARENLLSFNAPPPPTPWPWRGVPCEAPPSLPLAVAPAVVFLLSSTSTLRA